MNTYILIDGNNVIVNSAVCDGEFPFVPSDGTTPVFFDAEYAIGWLWDGAKAIAQQGSNVIIH